MSKITLLIFSDLSRQKKIEFEIKLAREMADASNQAKSSFLANMSHEIRTPVSAIMGFTSLIARGDLPPDEIVEYLGIIDRNSQQLLRIIDDILDLSKVEAGKVSIEKMSVCLSQLVTDLKGLLLPRSLEQNSELEFILNSDLPESISSDPVRLKQILVNVIGNALKFTKNGKVKVTLTLDSDSYLQIEVEDNGRGISEEQAKRLFQPFAQAEDSTTRLFGGTGLGLVLSKSLCILLGGDLTLVRSAIGKGSLFEIKIKLDPAELTTLNAKKNEDVKRSSTEKKTPLEGLRILLVEDAPDNQALFSILLKRAGAEVDTASDGIEAVRKAQEQDYSLVLMDVQMPRMDGYEATKRLRQGGCKIPIIALTAHAMPEEKERCLAAGYSNFLSKPLDSRCLFDILSELRNNETTVQEP